MRDMTVPATIFAPATAAGRAGVAMFRISGARARDIFWLMLGNKEIPEPRTVLYRKVYHPHSGEEIDHSIVLWFPAPNSYTGEDIVEIHSHGGRAVTSAIISALQTLDGFRLAEPGEFTRRAFENGKFDLTEAEAVGDLIHAETEAQRRQAMRQLDGALSRLYEGWRKRLTRSLAYMEASIDFADEELPADLAEKQSAELRTLAQEMDVHLDDRHRGERLRDGFSIAILGAPNAGKSSLLNALARRDAAIVSSTAGTTRDVIEVHLDLGGYPVILADTAGLRESVDAIENEGIRRALERANHADIKLLVFDGEAWPKRDATTMALADNNTIFVINKSDVLKSGVLGQAPDADDVLFVSAKTGEGIPELLRHLVAEIEQRFGGDAGVPLTQARHRAALVECRDHLNRAMGAEASELRAEDVRLAMRSLGRITGRVDVEDLLDVIFRDFCIGK